MKTQDSGLIFCGYLNKATRINGVKEGTLHLSRAHRQQNRIYSSMGTHPTLTSQGRYYIYDEGIVRDITIEERFRFMGFPNSFKKFGSSSGLFLRIGNSVCVPMIKEVAAGVVKQFFEGDRVAS